MSEGQSSIVQRALNFAQRCADAALDLAEGATTEAINYAELWADQIEKYVTEATGDPAKGAAARQEFLDEIL